MQSSLLQNKKRVSNASAKDTFWLSRTESIKRIICTYILNKAYKNLATNPLKHVVNTCSSLPHLKMFQKETWLVLNLKQTSHNFDIYFFTNYFFVRLSKYSVFHFTHTFVMWCYNLYYKYIIILVYVLFMKFISVFVSFSITCIPA